MLDRIECTAIGLIYILLAMISIALLSLAIIGFIALLSLAIIGFIDLLSKALEFIDNHVTFVNKFISWLDDFLWQNTSKFRYMFLASILLTLIWLVTLIAYPLGCKILGHNNISATVGQEGLITRSSLAQRRH